MQSISNKYHCRTVCDPLIDAREKATQCIIQKRSATSAANRRNADAGRQMRRMTRRGSSGQLFNVKLMDYASDRFRVSVGGVRSPERGTGRDDYVREIAGLKQQDALLRADAPLAIPPGSSPVTIDS